MLAGEIRDAFPTVKFPRGHPLIVQGRRRCLSFISGAISFVAARVGTPRNACTLDAPSRGIRAQFTPAAPSAAVSILLLCRLDAR
jgi:hypothetical protein